MSAGTETIVVGALVVLLLIPAQAQQMGLRVIIHLLKMVHMQILKQAEVALVVLGVLLVKMVLPAAAVQV